MHMLYIYTLEPELATSDQVCEHAAPSITVGALVEYEGVEVSPTHPAATESQSLLALMYCCFVLRVGSPVSSNPVRILIVIMRPAGPA